eukprot:TRINITY_DN1017_c0_g1_i1.p3 TRINITY_DN1017_c0_g1~~TRINITY_DN1017_c0_g1_i1.p3  ORF type:complete len:145 (-),score=54.33 TRINITY_DN1017_c0_g1_i1:1220-1633(-)
MQQQQLLAVGLKNEVSIVVKEEHTAAHYGSGLAPVLATPHLVGLFETTAAKAVEPLVGAGKSTVGACVTVKHLAPTPVGMKVTVKVELVQIDGPKLKFKGEAFDETDKIGECEHDRCIITYDRFMSRVKAKEEKVKH